MKRRASITLAILAGLYAASYCINTALGGYWMKPVGDGKDKYASGLSMPTAIIWQPRFGYATPFQKDKIGWFYLPLITLDRSVIHKTRYLTNSEDEQWLFSEEASKYAHPKQK
ncbi:hypothetical protein Ga0100231_015515 [Opitutaceae bacterium TAV4]|nr:hypothetical protein Ga0100231_015515 [Opitutaceae bacterium TAV4]RRJ99667.1 hypothetical protein Ga0100230_016345 [Opitutaceae bacterium TAV3]